MIHHLTPKFSVITVCRNAQAVIEDTIQSVISQTYHHVEYIVIDGASNDRTMSIVNRYRERISVVVSEPDRGLYDAMNKGIRLATGDYLCFLNAGDSFHEDDTLLRMAHSIHEPQLPDVLYGETELVDREGHFLRFARRDRVVPYDLRYRYSADFDWCIRVMKQSQVLHNTRLTLIDYLAEGLTTRNQRASLEERFRIMVKHYGWLSTVAHHAWFVLRLLTKR